MTHLRIELNNGSRENVNNGVISKLYDLTKDVKSRNGTVTLKGWLHANATYGEYITYLEDLFTVNGVKLLIIESDKKYKSFEDPEVLRILATTYGDGTGVTISELLGVTDINLIFKGNTTITKFNEFEYFTGITKNNVAWNKDMWFNGCTNLTEITIPKNIRNFYADQSCFGNCTSLLTVTFPEDSVLEEIGGFESCTSLSTISIPDSTSVIDGGAFRSCTSLTSINTNNVTLIKGYAFKGCSSLNTVNLQNVQEIHAECFANCPLNNITFNNNSILKIDQFAFSGCGLTGVNISFPNLLTLGGAAFNNTKIALVSNLGSITAIGNDTFRNCQNLTSVTFPSTCTSIGHNVFKDCTSLTTINNTSNITSVGEGVFNGCTSLGLGQTLDLNLTNLTTYPTMFLSGTKYTRLILHCPQLLDTYDSRWPAYAYMDLLLYLDLSDWRPARNAFDNNNYGDYSFYNNTSLVTYIAPITTNYIDTIISSLGNYSNFRYFILLSTTPPRLNTSDSNSPLSYWFLNKGGNVHIYVPDSAKLTYLADPDWASIGGYNGSDTIADRLHGLSELPAGVWTTGLASQYLTPAQLATS